MEVIYCRKREFYRNKVSDLKSVNPRKWWSMVNKLAGKASGPSDPSYADEGGNIISGESLATVLNDFVSLYLYR